MSRRPLETSGPACTHGHARAEAQCLHETGAAGRGDLKMVQVLVVLLPGYQISSVPDYSLGAKVDRAIRNHFDVTRIVIRGISSTDHAPLTLDQLGSRVLELGTDKYDPARNGVAHQEFEPYHADFQGGLFEVADGDSSYFAGVMRHFYEDAPRDRGYPLRIDLLLIYDRHQLERADRPDPGRPRVRSPLESFLFRFKYPSRKRDALLGLVKIE